MQVARQEHLSCPPYVGPCADIVKPEISRGGIVRLDRHRSDGPAAVIEPAGMVRHVPAHEMAGVPGVNEKRRGDDIDASAIRSDLLLLRTVGLTERGAVAR